MGGTVVIAFYTTEYHQFLIGGMSSAQMSEMLRISEQIRKRFAFLINHRDIGGIPSVKNH